MRDVDKLRADLDYVRDTVDGARRSDTPVSLYVLWGVVLGVGLPLYDLAPRAVPYYWPIAAPLGAVASFVIGWRHSRKIGQESAREGTSHALHWMGLLVAMFLAVLLFYRGEMTDDGLAAMTLLLSAFAWYLAGVHLAPAMLWLGLVQLAGFLAVVFVEGFSWTLAGAILAASLILTAVVEKVRGTKGA